MHDHFGIEVVPFFGYEPVVVCFNDPHHRHVDAAIGDYLPPTDNASFVLTWGIDAVLLAATAVVILSAAVFPRWTGWSAAVLAIGLLVGMAMPTSEFVLPFLLTLIWIVAISIILLRWPPVASEVARASF